MTLAPEQTLQARRELGAMLERTGLNADDCARDLGFTRSRAKAALAVAPATDPADVWAVRDYLDRALRDRGLEPVDCRVLSAANRVKALRWFHLIDPPAVGAGARAGAGAGARSGVGAGAEARGGADAGDGGGADARSDVGAAGAARAAGGTCEAGGAHEMSEVGGPGETSEARGASETGKVGPTPAS